MLISSGVIYGKRCNRPYRAHAPLDSPTTVGPYHWRNAAILFCSRLLIVLSSLLVGLMAQWKSVPFTPERSLVRSQLRPQTTPRVPCCVRVFLVSRCYRWRRLIAGWVGEVVGENRELPDAFRRLVSTRLARGHRTARNRYVSPHPRWFRLRASGGSVACRG